MAKITSALLLFMFLLPGCQDSEISSENYSETVMGLAIFESNNPQRFLQAEGQYRESFWGDKFKITVEITNSAKIASFKDAQIKVTYYSKTNSVIGTKDYTIYDILPAQRLTKIDMTIDNYDNVNTIGWNVIDAKASY